MVFSIFIIAAIGAVAYFHYTQGLFSAAISAICAILSAVITISYHETVIAMLLKGAAANYAQAMTLCVMYAAVYAILRGIADKCLPGNVRYPVLVDKIGAGALGVVAGLFSGGVLAMAAQSLPFGPSIAGYGRQTVSDRTVVIPGQRGQTDSETWDELKETTLDPAKASGMILPADDMVVSLVSKLSTGALSNDRPLAAIHPDWLGELFGQRLGTEAGVKRVLLNLPTLQMVDLKDVFVASEKIPQIDSEHKEIRGTLLMPEKPGPDEVLFVTRIHFDQNATDSDNKARVSTGAVRLLGWQEKGGAKVYVNYTPIGTLEDASVLYRNKPDDFLVLPGGKSADFVFKVNRADLFTDESPKAKELEIKKGVFVEVKRMARADLGGKIVKGAPTPSAEVAVERKPVEGAKNLPKRSPTGEASVPAAELSAGPVDVTKLQVSDRLFSPLNPGTFSGDEANITIGSSGNATIKKDKGYSKLSLNGAQTLALISKGDFATDQLFVPDGKKMVQVLAKPKGEAWAWAGELSKFELAEASGAKHKPNGAIARVRQTGGPDRMVGKYEAEAEVGSVDTGEGRPYDLYLLFNVPSGTNITSLNFDGKPISDKALAVP